MQFSSSHRQYLRKNTGLESGKKPTELPLEFSLQIPGMRSLGYSKFTVYMDIKQFTVWDVDGTYMNFKHEWHLIPY